MARVPARTAGRFGLNAVFIAGEVVDVKLGQSDTKLTICVKVRCRVPSKKYSTVTVSLYGIGAKAELMALVCEPGNYVYCEAEHRMSKQDGSAYLLCTYAECLCRRVKAKKPELSVVGVLDMTDPIGYIKPEEGRRRKRARRAHRKKKG